MGKGGRATGVYKADSGTVSTVIETQSACRDRLLCALRHEQPDRLPVDFGGTSVTGEGERLSGALDHSFARCWFSLLHLDTHRQEMPVTPRRSAHLRILHWSIEGSAPFPGGARRRSERFMIASAD